MPPPRLNNKLITKFDIWSGGVGRSSNSSKLESVNWSSGVIKESSGSVPGKSSKLVADSGEWESAKWSGGARARVQSSPEAPPTSLMRRDPFLVAGLAVGRMALHCELAT